VHGGTHWQLIAAAAVFGILNTILKPILRLITLPLAIITLGIAWFFVSMFMLWLTAVIVPGFSVHGFWTYVGATFVIWLLNTGIDFLLYDIGKSRGSSRVLPA
jgi:putative membrane protein